MGIFANTYQQPPECPTTSNAGSLPRLPHFASKMACRTRKTRPRQGPRLSLLVVPPASLRQRRSDHRLLDDRSDLCLEPELNRKPLRTFRVHVLPAPPRQNAPFGAFCIVLLSRRQACAVAEAIIDYSMIEATMPAPTVRPPSRMAKRSFSSIAIGTIKETSAEMLSPGITISVPSGSVTMPVTSVVRK